MLELVVVLHTGTHTPEVGTVFQTFAPPLTSNTTVKSLDVTEPRKESCPPPGFRL